MPKNPKASRLRQRLRQAGEELQRQLEHVLAERDPLIRGSFGTRRRVCGNPNCKCTRGERHESKYLTASDGGKARQVHVPAKDEVKVSTGVGRYRQFHRRRAKLAGLAEQLLECIDALGRSLLEPYPPDNPFPPPKRRGRPPKTRDAG